MKKAIFALLIISILLSACDNDNKITDSNEPAIEEQLTLSEVLDIINGKSDIFLSMRSGYTATQEVRVTEKFSGDYKKENNANIKTVLYVKAGLYEPIFKVEHRDSGRDYSETTYYVDGYKYNPDRYRKDKLTAIKYLSTYSLASEEDIIIEESDIKDFSYNNYYYSLTFSDEYLNENKKTENDYGFVQEYVFRIGIRNGELKEYLSTYKVYGDITDDDITIHYNYNVINTLVYSELIKFELPDFSDCYDADDVMEEEIGED